MLRLDLQKVFLVACTLYFATAQYDRDLASDSEVEDEEAQVKGTEYFSVPAFFVTFREALEACIIISILLKFLDKIDKAHLKKDVWIGSILGLVIAIAAGVAFIIAFYAVGENFFVGKQEKLFEGFLMLFATIIITVLAMSMLKINKFQEMWEAKLRTSLAKAEGQGTSLHRSTMFWIPFISVLREGLETVIFLAGVGAGYPAKSIPIPGILGLLIGLACGFILYRAGSKASIHIFLTASTVLLLFIAAGLFSHGVHEFQEIDGFGDYKNADGEIIGAWNKPLWNICDCCSNEHEFWGIMRAVFGYTCSPSGDEVFAYLMYWVLALLFIAFKLRSFCFSRIPLKGSTVSEKDHIAKGVPVDDGVEMQQQAVAYRA